MKIIETTPLVERTFTISVDEDDRQHLIGLLNAFKRRAEPHINGYPTKLALASQLIAILEKGRV